MVGSDTSGFLILVAFYSLAGLLNQLPVCVFFVLFLLLIYSIYVSIRISSFPVYFFFS